MRVSTVVPTVVFGLCAIATVVGIWAGQTMAQGNESKAGTKPLKVAVVDVDNVVRDSRIEQDLRREFEDVMAEVIKPQEDKLTKELKDADDALKQAEKDQVAEQVIENLRLAKERIREKYKELTEIAKVMRRDLNALYTAYIYAAAMIEIEEIAKSRNYDLVFRKVALAVDSGDEDSSSKKFQAQAAFSQRFGDASLLYFKGSESGSDYTIEDITKSVKRNLKVRPLTKFEEQIKEKLQRTSSVGGSSSNASEEDKGGDESSTPEGSSGESESADGAEGTNG